jgi:hypothetical protein
MLIKLTATPSNVLTQVVRPALALLPQNMRSQAAEVLLLAIGGQESGFATRQQYGGGPARGLWQFEQGTQSSKGGVWGVYLFPSTQADLQHVCTALRVPYDPVSIYNNLDQSDLLAACVARLMLWTSPSALPAVGDQNGAWNYYENIWRPGKPRPQDWPNHYQPALGAVQ